MSFNKTRFTDLNIANVRKVIIRFRDENGQEKELEVIITESIIIE